MTYTFKYRLRTDRIDNEGRVQVFADVYWPKCPRGAGHERMNGLFTGVSCLPENWMEERRKQAIAAGKRVPTGERFIYRSERGSLAFNLRLERIQAAINTVFAAAMYAVVMAETFLI